MVLLGALRVPMRSGEFSCSLGSGKRMIIGR
jgi:hypothetical protein